MTKEQKCISKELAIELQQVADEFKFELPESELKYFHGEWRNNKIDHAGCEIKDNWGLNRNYKVGKNENKYSEWLLPAYDASELGEMLPAILERNLELRIKKASNGFWVYYETEELSVSLPLLKAKYIQIPDLLQNGMCKMLIYLIRNKLL